MGKKLGERCTKLLVGIKKKGFHPVFRPRSLSAVSIVPIVLILLETRSPFFSYPLSLHRVMHPLLLFEKFDCFVLYKLYRLIRQVYHELKFSLWFRGKSNSHSIMEWHKNFLEHAFLIYICIFSVRALLLKIKTLHKKTQTFTLPRIDLCQTFYFLLRKRWLAETK